MVKYTFTREECIKWNKNPSVNPHSNKKIKPLNKSNINNNLIINKIIINNNQNNNELLKFLKIIKGESKINAIGFYDVHNIAKKRKLKTMMRKEDIIKKIGKKGFNAANTHFSGVGIRSDIQYGDILPHQN